MLKDSYGDVQNGELFLVGAHISPYAQGNIFNHEPERPRRLLLHKREIIKLYALVREKGLTIIPLKVYFKQGKVKIQIGLCRGKHVRDKRQTIQQRETEREMGRIMKEAQSGERGQNSGQRAQSGSGRWNRDPRSAGGDRGRGKTYRHADEVELRERLR